MLDEYVLVPDIFDPAAYSHPALIEVCLPHLKEPLLQESLVRDLSDGGWSKYCLDNAGGLHRLCKELLRKLVQNNRLRRFPLAAAAAPVSAIEWCHEGRAGIGTDSLTGIIASHGTKQHFDCGEVASIERLTGTPWWQRRSPSVTVDRKTADYLTVLRRVLIQARSLMFIDPNLDPSSWSYREFALLLEPLAGRDVKPRIEIHRSLAKGDGRDRTLPSVAEWQASFASLAQALRQRSLQAEVFGWDDFHDRYLIADVVGMTVPAGFDVTTKLNDFSTWNRLGREDKDRFQRLYDPAANAAKLKWQFAIGATP